MRLLSSNFGDMESLPDKFTCDGEGICPSFSWIDVPKEAKSFVFICDDPDAPAGNFRHLIVVNIPVETDKIEDIETLEGDFLLNSGGERNYFPPCPPSGAHRYVFSLYVLDIERIDPASIEKIELTIKPHIVASAKITGIYSRS
jgi:Raf kinase inhibitor-like YbhB/YbcL family protein